jgi:hypothetical protein
MAIVDLEVIPIRENAFKKTTRVRLIIVETGGTVYETVIDPRQANPNPIWTEIVTP